MVTLGWKILSPHYNNNDDDDDGNCHNGNNNNNNNSNNNNNNLYIHNFLTFYVITPIKQIGHVVTPYLVMF